jgi:hypothetical protein
MRAFLCFSSNRWLKDAATEADFFLDLQRMPATKL